MIVINEQAVSSSDALRKIAEKHDKYIEHMVLVIYSTDFEFKRNGNHWFDEIESFVEFHIKEKATNKLPKPMGIFNALYFGEISKSEFDENRTVSLKQYKKKALERERQVNRDLEFVKSSDYLDKLISEEIKDMTFYISECISDHEKLSYGEAEYIKIAVEKLRMKL